MKLILLFALLSLAVSRNFFVKSKTGKYYLVETQIRPKKVGMYPQGAGETLAFRKKKFSMSHFDNS